MALRRKQGIGPHPYEKIDTEYWENRAKKVNKKGKA
jgi:hypothetical protein